MIDKRKKYPLTPIERNILKTLAEERRWMSTRHIARRSNISWQSSDKYLNQFKNNSWVNHRTTGKKRKKGLWSAYDW